MNKIKDESTNIFNILYSDDFLISNYTNIYSIDNILKEEDKNYLNSLKYNKIDKIIKLDKIFLNLNINEPVNNNLFIYIKNYLHQHLNLIEENYVIPKYYLNIKKIFFVDLSDIKVTNNLKLVNIEKKNYDFIMFLNFSNENINLGKIKMYDEHLVINSNSCKILSSNLSIDLIRNENNKIIIVILLSILNGYDKFYYNKHPNQKNI